MGDTIQPDWDPRSKEVLRDQRAAFDDMRERCPVAQSEFLGTSLFRHEDVLRVLLDHETFSNVVSRHLSVPNGMDPPEHGRFRRFIDRFFEPDRMEAFEPTCRRIASDLIAGLRDRDELDAVTEFAVEFSAQVQCAFLGWPSTMHQTLLEWTRKNQEATLAQDREAMSEIAAELSCVVAEMLRVRRQSDFMGYDDVTSELMQGEVMGKPLRDEEIVSVLRNWTVGEIGSITASIGILVHFLAERPDLQETLRAQPALLPRAIEEILRIDGPLVANRRRATRTVDIGGRTIEAGERISLVWIAANRDPRAFDDPEQFSLDRDQKNNLLWGAGIHVCPGAPLARMEMRIVMEELLASAESIALSSSKAATRAVYPAAGFSSVPVEIRWAK